MGIIFKTAGLHISIDKYSRWIISVSSIATYMGSTPPPSPLFWQVQGGGRVVSVSSIGHLHGAVDINNLNRDA